jgi:nucleoside-diphosphate-sugar epimerase
MIHIILGGSGFTGARLAGTLVGRGEEVVIADIDDGGAERVPGARFVHCDITDRQALSMLLPFGPDAVVHHLAARQYHLPVPHRGQDAFFQAVNTAGTANILAAMKAADCHRLIFFSTDMVYGFPQSVPVATDHVRRPLGPYGRSKMLAEDLCFAARRDGMDITIFRPRLIIGPGRLGVLAKLFALIDKGLPVPLIGDGSNRYQMVAVHDCVAVVEAALAAGIPNREFNLGSDDPPQVWALLSELIRRAGSRSRLVRTPGGLVKATLACLAAAGLPLLHREQYAIADINYIVDITATKAGLGWQPRHGDADMVAAAFAEYLSLKPKNR